MIVRLSLAAACVIVLLTAVAQAQETPSDGPCPTISVSCPSDLKGDETSMVFAAKVTRGDPTVAPTYNWAVSAGRIIEGQGTSSIRVDISALGGQVPTATVTVGGFDLSCSSRTASCTLIIEHLPNALKFDSYGRLPVTEEKSRLAAFGVNLQNEPAAEGYILVYGGRRGLAGEAQKAAERAKTYLVKTRAVDAARIVTMDGGYQEALTIDLWLVPTGANPPAAQPTVDPSEVTIIGTVKKKRPKQ